MRTSASDGQVVQSCFPTEHEGIVQAIDVAQCRGAPAGDPGQLGLAVRVAHDGAINADQVGAAVGDDAV